MIRNAKDLLPDQKAAIESLLGRRILEDEAISVRAIEPAVLSEEQRQELSAGFEKYFSEVDIRRGPGSGADADDVLDEAIKSVRPSYSPRR